MFGLGKLGKMGRVGGVRATLASILSKYPGSHLWDFGVPADKVAHRKNLLNYSHDLSNNLAWQKVNSTAPVSATVSPDGTTCFALTDDSTNADHKIRQVVAVAAGTVVTFAVVAKAGTADYLWLYDGYANSGKNFNLSAQSALTAIGTAPSAFSVADMGGGWAIYVFSYTTSTTVRPEIGISIDGVGSNYVGTGSTVFIDAAGLYAGTYTAQQILDQGGIQRITDYYTEFLAAYPTHNLYQDSAGTTPAFLPTHPVGLCLDQPSGSVVLGAELNSNPGPFTATTGYTAGTFTAGALPTLSIVSSLLRVTTNGTNYGVAEMSFPTVVGKTYQVILGVSTISTGDRLIYRIGSTVQGYDYVDASLSSGATPSDYKMIFTATGTTCYVTFGNHATPPGSFTEFNRVTVKEVLGSHASQSTTTKRPVLSARVNLLVATEDFSNAAWETLIGGTGSVPVKTPGFTDPNGGNTAFRIQCNRGAGNTGADYSVVRQAVSISGPSIYTSSIWVKSNTGATQTFNLDVSNGQPVTATTSWTRVFSQQAAPGRFDISNYGSDGGTASLDILVWHPDIRPANSPTNLPAYQRVTTSTDYDTVGFPLRAVWDGVDDCLVVPTLDLSITDKVTVVAGVTKQSSVLGVVCELTAGSGSAPGSFGLLVPGAVADTQNWRSGGSVPAAGNINSSAITPPASLVLSAQGDIANDVSTLRSNGAEAATSSANQGTGNYSSSALYIGQRSANAVSFTGAIQSITLIPALITASETAVIEASVNNSMGKVY